MAIDNIIEEFVDVLKTGSAQPNRTYSAVVSRVDHEGTVWVRIAGSDKETPTASAATTVSKGDLVTVEWRNNKLYIAGNYTDPSAGTSRVVYVERFINVVGEKADKASADASTAQETATVAQGTASVAKETAEAILIYDHAYSYENGTFTFTAYLYQGGIDVKTKYRPEQFTWFYKTEDGQQSIPLANNLIDGTYENYGYTITISDSTPVTIADFGYGGHVIGHFVTDEEAQLLTESGDSLTDVEDVPYTVRASGEAVRVSNLTVATSLFSTDKLMIVGSEDEHLVSVQTLQDYLNANLDKQVLFNTEAGWSAQTSLVSKANTIYVYTDHSVDPQGNNVAGIKVGDGSAYVVDLPFIDAIVTEHMADTTLHITDTERTFWNNKVRCYYAGTEQLVFTTA